MSQNKTVLKKQKELNSIGNSEILHVKLNRKKKKKEKKLQT